MLTTLGVYLKFLKIYRTIALDLNSYIFFSLYYSDFSPGTITAVLVYLPGNYLIVRAAFQEGYLKSYIEYGYIALLGTTTFVLFEIYGPVIIGLSIICSLLYFAWSNKRLSNG